MRALMWPPYGQQPQTEKGFFPPLLSRFQLITEASFRPDHQLLGVWCTISWLAPLEPLVGREYICTLLRTIVEQCGCIKLEILKANMHKGFANQCGCVKLEILKAKHTSRICESVSCD